MDQGFHPSVVAVDGVPVVSAPLEGRATATLFFTVGSRDETPRTAGLAHLIEHVVMRRVGRVTAMHNATTEADSISFYVTGTDDEIVDFLDRVSRAIAWLPECGEDDVAPERRTIATELGPGAELGRVGPLTVRYGLVDVGLVDAGQRTFRTVGVDAIHDFARRFLHRGNAAVTITGGVPEGLRLPLPDGERRPPRIPPVAIRKDLPGHIIADAAPLTLSFELSGSRQISNAVVGCLEAFLTRVVRGDRQLVYSWGVAAFGLGDDRRVVSLSTDPTREATSETLESLVVELREIARRGPDRLDLEYSRASFRSATGQTAAAAAWLRTVAVAEARGRRDSLGTFAEEIDRVLEVDEDEIREAVSGALESLIVTVVWPDFPGTPERLHLNPLVNGNSVIPDRVAMPILGLTFAKYRVLAPRSRRGLGAVRLVVSDGAIAELTPGGVFEVPLADVVVAGRFSDGAVSLATSTGRMFYLRPADWRDPGGRIRRALARIPDEHWYEIAL